MKNAQDYTSGRIFSDVSPSSFQQELPDGLIARACAGEVAAFARKYGIPQSEAQTIIKRYGPSRKKLDNHMAARG